MSAATAPHPILGDKYRLIRPLDKGGMGSVWLAEHLALASPVAIKLITANVAKTTDRLQRFLREARAAAAARSPHVVQILDYGVHEGTPYIVMELLEGESLAERLQRRGHLGNRETEMVVRHVSRAVTRAHEAGVVHRDLKPANIFITRNDEEEIVKVFDFGIAKGAEALGPSLALAAGIGKATRTGSLLGTPYYMSPEQLEGGRHSDHRTDIWALGVIAFECLLGRLPFNGRGIGGLVLAVCSHPLPIPSQLAEVPPGFDAWFARACSRDLGQRFASAREAASSLREVLGSGVDRGGGADRGMPAVAPEAPLAGLEAPLAGLEAPLAGLEAPLAGLAAPLERGFNSDPVGAIRATRTMIGGARIDIPAAPGASSAAEVSCPASARTMLTAVPPATPDPSSATLHREKPRARPVVWLAPIVACAAIALALQGFRGSADATDGAPGGAAVESAVQPLAPAPARLIVLGEGSELRASVDGQDIGPVPCEVQGVAPGEHAVVISGSARYRPSHHRVQLEPGGLATIGPAKLEVARGLATLVASESTDGAKLSLSMGDTTLPVPALPVQLEVETAQRPVLHAEKPGFEAYHLPLSFEDGDAEKTFAVTLTPLQRGEPAARGARATKKGSKANGRRSSSRRSRPRSPAAVPPSAPRVAAAADAAGRAAKPMVAAMSTFTFTATPESSVLLDGAPLGRTPLYDVPVAVGPHRVIFIHGAQRKAMLVVGGSGKAKVVSASFRPPRER